jgi:hypothetical protein
MGGSSSGILNLPGQGPRTPMSAMLGLDFPSVAPSTPMAGPQAATQVSPVATSTTPAVTLPQPSVQLPSIPAPQDFVQPQSQTTPAQQPPMAQALASNLTTMPNQMQNWLTAAPLSVQRLMSSQQTWPGLRAQYFGNIGPSIVSNPPGNPFDLFNPFFRR